MPVHTTRPRQASSRRQAALNAPSMRAAIASSPLHPVASTRRPLAAKSKSAGARSAGMGEGGFRYTDAFSLRAPVPAAMNADRIRALIEAGLPGARVDVQGGTAYFEAQVVSEAFRGKLPLARHRMVYATLGETDGRRDPRASPCARRRRRGRNW